MNEISISPWSESSIVEMVITILENTREIITQHTNIASDECQSEDG
jgi:hypothetical protein